MSEKLADAYAREWAARRKLHEVLRTEYPLGAQINWVRDGMLRTGTVKQHSSSDRIQVTNAATGRTPWIHAYDVVEAQKHTRRLARVADEIRVAQA